MYFYIHNFYEPHQVSFFFWGGGGVEPLFSNLPYVMDNIRITHV